MEIGYRKWRMVRKEVMEDGEEGESLRHMHLVGWNLTGFRVGEDY